MAEVNARVEIDDAELTRQSTAHAVRKMASWKRQTATQARADVPVLTGNLGRSIGEGETRIVGRTVRGSVHATADYAAPVHEGRRARVIRPVRAQALRFQIGGRVVFAKVVRQGPMKGRPFLRNAGLRVAGRMR